MKKRIGWIVITLICILVLAFLLHVVASVLFDGPIALSFTSEGISDDIESFLSRKMSLLHPRFEYIGYSTGDIDSPDSSAAFSWYTSPMPGYIALGTDAYILCLAHFDHLKNEVDYINAYIGSSRAIDSITRRYSYSFHRVN